jgi:predicted HicB family RNase H-like nuclease
MPRPYLPEGKAKDKKFQIRVSETELNAIEKLANSQNVSISTLFRIALKEYAKNMKC